MLIPTSKNVRNVTSFREDPDKLFRDIEETEGPLYLFKGSEPKAVALSLKEYIAMREMIEDYQDNLRAIEIEKQPRGKLVPFKDIKDEFKLKTD